MQQGSAFSTPIKQWASRMPQRSSCLMVGISSLGIGLCRRTLLCCCNRAQSMPQPRSSSKETSTCSTTPLFMSLQAHRCEDTLSFQHSPLSLGEPQPIESVATQSLCVRFLHCGVRECGGGSWNWSGLVANLVYLSQEPSLNLQYRLQPANER